MNGGDFFCLTGTMYISLIYLTGPPFLTFFSLPTHQVAKGMGHSTLANGSTARGLLLEQPLSIAYTELFPIVIACHVWGSKWRDRRIQFCCDNQGVVAVISSGTSKDTRLMQLLRELFLCAVQFNFMVSAKHVPGKENAIADSLSRFNMQVFRQLVPRFQPVPVYVAIPPSLLVRLNS